MGLRAFKIDALSLAEELENAGIPRPQADAQIKTTIRVVDMAIEERLVTKHDLTHGLHLTEKKLMAEISKTEEKLLAEISKTENKVMTVIAKTEEKLMTEISKTNADLRHVEEKLSNKIDKINCELTDIKITQTALSHKIDNAFQKTTIILGGVVVGTAGLLATLQHFF